MSTILSNVGLIVSSSIQWLTAFLGVFTETVATDGGTTVANPLLLLFVIIPVAGLGIGFLKRLMHL